MIEWLLSSNRNGSRKLDLFDGQSVRLLALMAVIQGWKGKETLQML